MRNSYEHSGTGGSRRRTGSLGWLSGLGWQVAHGPDIASGTPNAERGDYGQVVMERRLQDSLAGLNPGLPLSQPGNVYV